MQCVNCQFENMPGSGQCARCGTSLRLAAVAIAVEPPRASAWRKRARRLLPRRLTTRRLQAVSAIEHDLGVAIPRLGEWWRLVVPGLLQFHRGARVKGWLFLSVYLSLLTLTMVTYGSGFGFFAYGQAIAIHSLSCFDALLSGRDGVLRGRVLTGLLVTCLLLPVYLGIARNLSYWIDARHLMLVAPPFARNDTILINPRAYRTRTPQVGDVALYDIPRTTVRDRADGGRNIILVMQGERFDRILAGPGDTVLWDGGDFYVNGRPARHLPLRKPILSPHFELFVPAGHYAIIPSVDPQLARLAAGGGLGQLALVPRERIAGRVIVRHYPPWRFWWLE